jgi:hypothetical protein
LQTKNTCPQQQMIRRSDSKPTIASRELVPLTQDVRQRRRFQANGNLKARANGLSPFVAGLRDRHADSRTRPSCRRLRRDHDCDDGLGSMVTGDSDGNGTL